VRFAEQTLIPQEETYFSDDDASTCTEFSVGKDAQLPISSHFRIGLPLDHGNLINASMTGIHIKCDDSFYVAPLSFAETKKWTGIWTTCTLNTKTMYGRKETCLYGCRCSGCCEEIQIIRMPSSIAASSWFLCDLQLTFEPGI